MLLGFSIDVLEEWARVCCVHVFLVTCYIVAFGIQSFSFLLKIIVENVQLLFLQFIFVKGACKRYLKKGKRYLNLVFFPSNQIGNYPPPKKKKNYPVCTKNLLYGQAANQLTSFCVLIGQRAQPYNKHIHRYIYVYIYIYI